MSGRSSLTNARKGRSLSQADRLRRLAEERLGDFPSSIHIRDWTGAHYTVGRGEPHWSGRDLEIDLKTPAAGARILARDPMGFLNKFLEVGALF